ncbi:hypothetical protein U8D42_05625 [Mycobacterium europaeum]|uniref:hypothetical protein n=1 Tax=Mycobacterium europaeum TaxID=761804 RepID=UPI002ADF5438|nr:hypothetical protein [Mycobacterium europaeum]MEA1158963.1 hypothetical protein [Mycobacterium europaeum]
MSAIDLKWEVLSKSPFQDLHRQQCASKEGPLKHAATQRETIRMRQRMAVGIT